MAAFVLLQATNATGMTIMTVYVTETLRLDVLWAGIALGVAAALEVPALMLIGRLTERVLQPRLIATSCVAGIAYYLGLAFVNGPILLIGLQLLNAWSFAGIAGIGLPLFQQLIPRPGLSTGLYMNTRRIGAIVSGPIIAARLTHRPRPTRHLPHQRRRHRPRAAHHRHRQPHPHQACTSRAIARDSLIRTDALLPRNGPRPGARPGGTNRAGRRVGPSGEITGRSR